MESPKNFLKICLALVLVCRSLSYEPHCGQLGCDQAGRFTQDAYKLPSSKQRQVAWTSKHPGLLSMNAQNENYGCVGSSKLVVCPYHEDILLKSRHIILNTDTGEEYDTSGYETLENVNMPVLTEDNLVFAVNSSHASLVDALNNRSFITTLPTKNLQGVHSPIYLPDLGFFVVFGNMSLNHTIYKVSQDFTTGHSALDLVATFTIEKNSTLPCPWLPFTEAIANGSRVYLYLTHVDESTGIVAIDFMKKAPYYKKAWVLSDDQSGLVSPASKYMKGKDSDNCTFAPGVDPEYSIFPPIDVSTQMLATSDGYLVITATTGLLVIKDHGDSGEQTGISLFGAHFLSFDTSPMVHQKPPIVWMTGWPQYPPFREFLIAFNYTNFASDQSIWTIELDQYLGVAELNVTSRITTFTDPVYKDRKVLVFGVSVNYNDTASRFHTKYCEDCKLGINNMLMSVRTSLNNTMTPDILWMTSVPLSSSTMEIRGQIIGVSDKLVTYITDGKLGNVVAFK